MPSSRIHYGVAQQARQLTSDFGGCQGHVLQLKFPLRLEWCFWLEEKLCPHHAIASEFGYDEFTTPYLGVSHNLALMGLSKAPSSIRPILAAKNPQHVCLAALHGHMLYRC